MDGSVGKSGDNFHLLEPMRRLGVSQAAVARELGCAGSTVSRFLKGERPLPDGQGERSFMAAARAASKKKTRATEAQQRETAA